MSTSMRKQAMQGTTKAYQDFIERARNWLFDLPESDLLMPLIRLRFTPEEAAFPHLPHTLEQLVQQLNISASVAGYVPINALPGVSTWSAGTRMPISRKVFHMPARAC